jgi:hypothetical protein
MRIVAAVVLVAVIVGAGVVLWIESGWGGN